MDKLLDPSFWGTSWEQFRSAPGVTITLLLVWGAFVWWLRGHLKANEISGLKGQIHILEQRRQLAVEERTAEKKELLEEVDALKKHFAALEGQKIEDEARLDTFVNEINRLATEWSSANNQLDQTLSRPGSVPLTEEERRAVER